ncbi:MAG: ribosomal protein S18-alanine N-acetyltransferase [OCS116 cluster bacterium]|nr:ribosomal protein S18-alanine N-acetyltransferase [OCS116 cluster bacterium]
MTLTFQNIKKQFAEIATIHAHSFEHAWSETVLKDMFCNPQYSGTLVLQNNQVIGFIICTTVLDEAEIISIAISTEQRGKAFAAQLLNYEVKRLQNLSIKKLHLEVNQSNIAAIKLYQTTGFSQIAVRKNYYKLASGNRTNALIFSLNI